jgi:hypothetical protein
VAVPAEVTLGSYLFVNYADPSLIIGVEGGYCDNEDNLYSDVVLAISGDNFFSYRANSSFDLAKDQEFEREFTFEFGEAPSQSLLDKVSAVILLHKKNADGSSEVNNCAECAYGKTLDYRYN